jgi:hypothetical protein
MVAPSSGLIAEFFLQHTENTHLAALSHKHKIINYIIYVDDVLVIYDFTHANIHHILTDFNAIHPNLQFTAETEVDNTINYLDVSIHRSPNIMRTSIYGKPTYIDTIIPYTSNHPSQHKYAAIKFLFNRLRSYNLKETEHRQGLNTIHNVMHNNTTIQNLLTHRNPNPDKFSSSGVYKLSCPKCGKAYVGQAGGRFSLRYKEHRCAFYNNTPSSSFTQHLLDKVHPFGPIHEIMQLLYHHSKGPHRNTMEKFHIYAEYTDRSHLNDEHTIFPNKIFYSLMKPGSLKTQHSAPTPPTSHSHNFQRLLS